MDLTKVFHKNAINLHLRAKNRKDAALELTELWERQGVFKNREEFLQAVEEREQVASTYCGNGIAIPHGISETVIKPAFCFGRADGFLWNDDDDPVDLIVLLAIPKDKTKNSAHIEMLSSLSVAFLDDDMLHVLRTTDSVEHAYEAIIHAIK